jgi:hypothetical protein
MALRSTLAAVIAVATVAFVIGTAIERTTGETQRAVEGGESAEHRAAEGAGSESNGEVKPLGIDIEAAPFVALAAIASLALAAAAWLRPRTIAVLALVAMAMVGFAALDVREVFHQADEGRTGLAVLAACIAALHLAAAALAAAMIRAATAGAPPRGYGGSTARSGRPRT